MESVTVSREITAELIGRQLAMWRNTLEDCRIQMCVADAIGDSEDRKEMIRKESTRCIKAIEKLMAMLAELGETNGASTTTVHNEAAEDSG